MHFVRHLHIFVFSFIYGRNAEQKASSEKCLSDLSDLYNGIPALHVSLVLRLDAHDTGDRNPVIGIRFPGNGAKLRFPSECTVLLHPEFKHDDDEKR